MLEVEAFHEPFIRKRQRAAALQDASEGHVLPGFREVLDCASPLALWLPLQKWVHGTEARPFLEVEDSHDLGPHHRRILWHFLQNLRDDVVGRDPLGVGFEVEN